MFCLDISDIHKAKQTQKKKLWVFLTHYNEVRGSLNSVLFGLVSIHCPQWLNSCPIQAEKKLHQCVWKVSIQKGSSTNQSLGGLSSKGTYSCLKSFLHSDTVVTGCFGDMVHLVIPRGCPSCLQRDVHIVRRALLISWPPAAFLYLINILSVFHVISVSIPTIIIICTVLLYGCLSALQRDTRSRWYTQTSFIHRFWDLELESF